LKRRLVTSFVAGSLGLVMLVSTRPARAEAAAPEQRFSEGAEALRTGDYRNALFAFEELADRGYYHPDASFDRGLAYVMRVRENAGKPGDLGRAAAAFEESLRMRPDDDDAERALDLVRAEVTRRRSRSAKDAVEVRPTLDRMVIALATERTWGIAALLASLLLALGLALRTRPTGRLHVTGSVLAPTALLATLVLAPITWAAGELVRRKQPGVVVVSEVHLTDRQGKSLGGPALPEAAWVEVGDRHEANVHVRWGPTQGWVPVSSVQILGP